MQMRVNLKRCWLFFALALMVSAQTKIDLRSQSRNVDFSQTLSVRPFRTGTLLPATCSVGEMFFKTDAPIGANTYGCAATNLWANQGIGSSVGGGSETVFVANVNTATNTLTITCSVGQCNSQTGDVVSAFSNLQAVYTPLTGTYTAYVYLEGNLLRYGYTAGTMTACTTGCVTGITQFPRNVVPLYTIVVISGVLQSTSLTDRRSYFRAPKRLVSGAGMIVSETADTISIATADTLRNQPSGTRPACSVSTRGMFWHTNGASGAKDAVEVCARDAMEAYAWRTIY